MSKREYTVYKLHFTGPLHISDSKEDYGSSLQTFSSDSFYAAITATLAKQGLIIPNTGDLGCVISALFPYYQKSMNDECVFFFPKPLSFTIPRLINNSSLSKELKKITWLDTYLFEKILFSPEIINLQDYSNRIHGAFVSVAPLDSNFICSEVVGRASISRTYEDANPFVIDRITFKGNSGLFFLVEGDTSLIDTALPLLCVEGIGSDKNVGFGLFEFEKSSLSLNVPDGTSFGVSLSTFIPESKEQLTSFIGNYSQYELKRIGGWISSPPYISIRKNAIYSFAPGSVFEGLKSKAGKIVNLAPANIVDHPVWRCGKALAIPICL